MCGRVGGTENWQNGLYQAVCIVGVFWLLLLLGPGSRMTDSRTLRCCRWLGALSYPLYLTHFQLIFLQLAFVHHHPDAAPWQKWMVGIGVLAMSIFIAYAVQKAYVEPIRRWLSRHWLQRR